MIILAIFSILGWSRVFFSSAFLYFIVLNLFDKHFSSFLISKTGYLFYNAFFYFIIINLFDKHFSSILISKAGYLFVLPFYLRLLKINSAAYSRQSTIKSKDICIPALIVDSEIFHSLAFIINLVRKLYIAM